MMVEMKQSRIKPTISNPMKVVVAAARHLPKVTTAAATLVLKSVAAVR